MVLGTVLFNTLAAAFLLVIALAGVSLHSGSVALLLQFGVVAHLVGNV